jgi:hypothetical protein
VLLDALNAQEYIDDWFHLVTISFLRAVKDYLLLGVAQDAKAEQDIRECTTADLTDLEEIMKRYGMLLTERVKTGTLQQEQVLQVHNALLITAKERMWR